MTPVQPFVWEASGDASALPAVSPVESRPSAVKSRSLPTSCATGSLQHILNKEITGELQYVL